MGLIARRSLDVGCFHAAMVAFELCAAHTDAIAKVPSLRTDRVDGGRRLSGWARLDRRRVALCP
jgi:hypothetical protein